MQYTTYYSLSQIESTDKPTWLVMYNADMSAIDAGIHAAQADATAAGTLANTADGKADANALDIVDIKADIVNLQTAVGTATGNINTINSLIGDGTSLLTGQTIIAGLNSTDESIAPVENSATVGASYAIGDKFIRGGVRFEALTAITAGTAFSALSVGTDYKIADDISSEIRTLSDSLDELNNKWIAVSFNADRAHVTADGIKTYAQLITELYSAMTAYIAGLADDRAVEFTSYSIDGVGSFKSLINAVYVNSANYFTFSGNTIGNDPGTQSFNHAQLNFGNGYSQYSSFKADSNGNTFSDLSSNVPANGVNIYAIGTVYKKL